MTDDRARLMRAVEKAHEEWDRAEDAVSAAREVAHAMHQRFVAALDAQRAHNKAHPEATP